MKSPRRGITLVEMLVSLTVGSAAVGLATMLLTQVMRQERTARTQVTWHLTLDRLASVFREDAHQAFSADLLRAGTERSPAGSLPAGEKDGQSGSGAPAPIFTMLVLELPGGRSVTYWQNGSELAREETVTGTLVQQERFKLPATFGPIVWDWQPESRLISLEIPRGMAGPQAPPSVRIIGRVKGDRP